MHTDDVKVIQGGHRQPRARVFADLQHKQAQAMQSHVRFFESDAHVHKVDQVRVIVESFFTVRKAVYVNHRANKGKPFTVIKVEQPEFPRMSQARIDVLYREPLKALGVEVVFSKASNSMLYRVR
jgi:hypothetical protein